MPATYWCGKTVLITGASSGIGLALARALAERGARLALVARRADRLAVLAADIAGTGGAVLPLAGDVRDAAAMASVVSRVREAWGPVDVLIANAGIGGPTPATDLDAAAVSETFAINVLGAVNAAAAVLPDMLARGQGQLVAISSLASRRGLPGSAAYSASKAALSTLFESLRVDLVHRGIAVTTILPGFVESEMTARNRFPMPFLMPAGRAAELMCRAMERRRRTYAFPWPMALLTALIRALPPGVYDRLVGGTAEGWLRRPR